MDSSCSSQNYEPNREPLPNGWGPGPQMIGWWLKSAEGHRELQWQCEQAALWDWATYNVLRRPHPPDSLMNLEPAMLVMYQSLPKVCTRRFSFLPWAGMGSGAWVEHPPEKLEGGEIFFDSLKVGHKLGFNIVPLCGAGAWALGLGVENQPAELEGVIKTFLAHCIPPRPERKQS